MRAHKRPPDRNMSVIVHVYIYIYIYIYTYLLLLLFFNITTSIVYYTICNLYTGAHGPRGRDEEGPDGAPVCIINIIMIILLLLLMIIIIIITTIIITGPDGAPVRIIHREFRDVVFEDVVLDNNSYVTPH